MQFATPKNALLKPAQETKRLVETDLVRRDSRAQTRPKDSEQEGLTTIRSERLALRDAALAAQDDRAKKFRPLR